MTWSFEGDHGPRPINADVPRLLCRSDTGCKRSTPRGARESRSPSRWLSVAIAIAFSSACCGCGTQATIVLKNGNNVRGRIVEKRDGFLVAETEQQGVFGVHEQHVQEVRHPGTGAMIAGGILIGAAALLTTSAVLTDCTKESGDTECKMGRDLSFLAAGASGATGLGIGLYGVSVNEHSMDRAAGRREPGLEARHNSGHGVAFITRF